MRELTEKHEPIADCDCQECAIYARNELRTAANALLHQIDIGDFMDSHGHEAKMLKATHDLMRILGNPCSCRVGECEGVSDKTCQIAEEVRAKVVGVGRDAENDRVMVVYFDKPPSNDRLRGLNEMLRTRDEVKARVPRSA